MNIMHQMETYKFKKRVLQITKIDPEDQFLIEAIENFKN